MRDDWQNRRLNSVANALMDAWAEHIPLSVRYQAAEAADRIVADWFEQVKNGGNNGGVPGPIQDPPGQDVCPTCGRPDPARPALTSPSVTFRSHLTPYGDGLKIRCSQGREGSNPSSGTQVRTYDQAAGFEKKSGVVAEKVARIA